MKNIHVGILGLGTVGTGVVNLLYEQRELIKRRLGVEVIVSRIADRSAHRKNAKGVRQRTARTGRTAETSRSRMEQNCFSARLARAPHMS